MLYLLRELFRRTVLVPDLIVDLEGGLESGAHWVHNLVPEGARGRIIDLLLGRRRCRLIFEVYREHEVQLWCLLLLE